MREMNLLDAVRPKNNLERIKVIFTRASQKIRPEEEMILLMKSARNRFRRTVATGRIEIVSEREWRIR